MHDFEDFFKILASPNILTFHVEITRTAIKSFLALRKVKNGLVDVLALVVAQIHCAVETILFADGIQCCL